MQDQNIVPQVSPNSTALNAEHYQSFEMAKDNDGIIGGDDIAQIRSYAAFARAQAQAVHKSIASMSELEDVTATKAEMTETAQTFAKVSVYADERIGEILRSIEQAKRGPKVNSPEGEKTKTETIRESGMSTKTAYDLQAMADNPEVVEAVIAKAEQDGRVVSRSQVLKAIKERDEARKDAEEVSELYGKTVVQRDQAESERNRIERELRKASITQTNLEMEAESLRQQLAQRPDPEVIEREVVPEDVQKRIRDLEHEQRIYLDTDRKLRDQLRDVRKELDRAKGIIGMDKGTRDVQRDVEYLISATNQYVRHYGGLTWTFERIAEVDEITRNELRKAVKNLATFSSALVASLEHMQ